VSIMVSQCYRWCLAEGYLTEISAEDEKRIKGVFATMRYTNPRLIYFTIITNSQPCWHRRPPCVCARSRQTRQQQRRGTAQDRRLGRRRRRRRWRSTARWHLSCLSRQHHTACHRPSRATIGRTAYAVSGLPVVGESRLKTGRGTVNLRRFDNDSVYSNVKGQVIDYFLPRNACA